MGVLQGSQQHCTVAERGYSVTLLEASRIGWAASGRNGGQLVSGYSCSPETFTKFLSKNEAGLIYEMGIKSVEFVKENIRIHNINCDFVSGGLRVASNGREMDRLKNRAHYWVENFGYEAQYLSADKLPMHIHSPRYCGGVYYPEHGHLHPLNSSVRMDTSERAVLLKFTMKNKRLSCLSSKEGSFGVAPIDIISARLNEISQWHTATHLANLLGRLYFLTQN